MAIFRAQAALGVHQKIELHRLAEPAAADLERAGEQIEQVVVTAPQDGEGLGFADLMPGEHTIRQLPPIVPRSDFR